MKLLRWLANLIKKFLMKSIFITIIMIALLTIGVQNIFMATGDDTLVKTDTDVYQDNQMLEEEFGGEGIIVLYESDNLLTPDNLKHMKGLEEELKTNDAIYSMMSPVTLVEEIADKQSDTFKEGIVDVIDGLDEMGGQLSDIGEELEENAESSPDMEFPDMGDLELPEMEDPELPEFGGLELPETEGPSLPEFGEFELPESGELELPEVGEVELPELEMPGLDVIDFTDMEEQMEELDQAFSGMIEAQENLGDGTGNLVEGYVEFGEQLNNVGKNLEMMANQLDSPQKEQLLEVSEQVTFLSEQTIGISEDTEQLPEIPEQTIMGLSKVQEQLNEQVQEQMEMIEEQEEQQVEMEAELEKKEEDLKKQMKEQQEAEQEEMKQEMQERQAAEEEEMKQEIKGRQEAQQEEMKQEMQEKQKAEEEEMKQEMEKQQEAQKEEMKQEMEEQQEAQRNEMKDEMEEKQAEQADMLLKLSEGLATMGGNLEEISENIENIHDYSDIMTPGLPSKQTTLDNMIYEDDDELRSIFDDVVVDDNQMLMTIKLEGKASDTKKSDVIDEINTYLDNTESDSLETLVSGKPVLDDSIKSSMQESIQKMMGLALLLMVIVLFIVFKVRWRLLPLLIVLAAVIGTVGLMGWLQIPITMVSMAVFPILIGLGIDYAIQFQNRYTEELTKEDEHE